MENEDGREPKRANEASAKKPYHPPKILYREPLEAMAALCAPAPPAKANPGACPTFIAS